MKRSEIYRLAAQRIELGLCYSACSAIGAAAASNGVNSYVRHDMRQKLAALFCPLNAKDPCGVYWWMFNEDGPRILALCFMAAIAEDEERDSEGRKR